MCVTSLVTASKERQTGAKSCKAGKLHSADEIISFTLDRISVTATSTAPSGRRSADSSTGRWSPRRCRSTAGPWRGNEIRCQFWVSVAGPPC
jgi:hypothetical protein